MVSDCARVCGIIKVEGTVLVHDRQEWQRLARKCMSGLTVPWNGSLHQMAFVRWSCLFCGFVKEKNIVLMTMKA